MSKSFLEDYLNKLEEWIKKYKETRVLIEKVKYQEKIQKNRQNRRIQSEKQALNTYRESLIKKRNNDTLKR